MRVCIVCREEAKKGRSDMDAETGSVQWFCWECFNTIQAVHKAWDEEDNKCITKTEEKQKMATR